MSLLISRQRLLSAMGQLPPGKATQHPSFGILLEAHDPLIESLKRLLGATQTPEGQRMHLMPAPIVVIGQPILHLAEQRFKLWQIS